MPIASWPPPSRAGPTAISIATSSRTRCSASSPSARWCCSRSITTAITSKAWSAAAVDEEHFRKLERMYDAAPINQYFRPVLTVGDALAEVAIVVRPDFFHAANAVHGSIYFKAMDDAAFFAVNSIVHDVFV